MYDQYADDIFRYLFVRVRDRELAEDLTADTFTKAWTGIDSFDFKQPRPWLYRIAQNVLTDYWRKARPLPLDETIEIESDENVEENVDRELTREHVWKAIHLLEEPMQSVVTMRFILGYSARETATALGLSEENVRVVQYRALKKMRGYVA